MLVFCMRMSELALAMSRDSGIADSVNSSCYWNRMPPCLELRPHVLFDI